MRPRFKLLFSLPLLGILVTGCSPSNQGTTAPKATPNLAETPSSKKPDAKTPKKPKDLSNLTGPTQLVQ
jgi:hypothetical protein